jgi:hypothetical protein
MRMSKLATMLQVGRTFGVRDGMLRLEYELRRGSGLMSWKMRSVQGWDSWELGNIAPDSSADEILRARQNGSARFFFGNSLALGTKIRTIIGPAGEKSALDDAELILAGNLPFFGQLSFNCHFPPRWFRNPTTGQSVSPHQPWTHMRFASPDYGDLKFILEPSRFLFVYPLARAYALSADERFPQTFWRAIEDWVQHSPPMSGPLWICGQECSLRILAWTFALHAFIHSPSTTPERAALLISMIAAHAWRTAQTLGYARSQRSNHLITEAVGLWTAGTLYPELREAEVWKNLGAHLLHKAVLDQITEHGVSQQHSFNYQRMILHLLLWTLRLSEIHNAPLHEDIRARTHAAADFMRAWLDPISGLVPNYGSDDGSLILPLVQASYRDYRPLLQLAAAVLHHPVLPFGPWDELALWFGVTPQTASQINTELSSIDTNTGYFHLGDKNTWALIRAGQYVRRPFQADQLHVDLWWQGINLARDPGTYLYNGPEPWNNAFAATAVHNTITVDGRNQMRRASRFLWVDWAQASGRAYRQSGAAFADRFEGEHDGYKKLGVKHRRAVQWLAGAGWIIVDDIEGNGKHTARLHWLLADLPYHVSDSPFQVVLRSGESRLRWYLFASVPGSGAVVRGGLVTHLGGGNGFSGSDTNLLGWESLTYGDLRPVVSLLYQTQSQLPIRFVTVVLTDENVRLDVNAGEIAILRNDSSEKSLPNSEIYRVSLSRPITGITTDLPLSIPKA